MPLVVTPREFKYDVAFSFLEEDEGTAYALNDLVQDRLRTFIYSQEQKEGVGRDGMTWFKTVFAQEARIVVVLYREAWGYTDWTRVEEEAIKERVLDESSDFIVFINLDRGKPNWLSRTHIRLYLDRYGLKEAAAIIEHRVREYGGVVREESVEDQFARHKRDLDTRLALANYLKTSEAVTHAQDEWTNLFSALQETAEKLRYGRSSHKENGRFVCFSQGVALGFHLRIPHSNSLEGSSLQIALANTDHFDDFPRKNGRIYQSWQYKFSRNLSQEHGWRNTKDEGDFKKSQVLIQQSFKPFLDRVRAEILVNEKHRYQVE